MALVVRILCHNGNGPCLLQHLRLLKDTWFYDTASAIQGVTPAGDPFVSVFPSTLIAIRATPEEMQAVAPLDNRPPASLTWNRFQPWWNKPVLSPDLSKALVAGPVQESTRRDLVLWLANQDGGAHVDGMIDAEYDSVRGATFGTIHASDGTRKIIKMPIAASMRQVAHEVLVTMQEYTGVEPPSRATDPTTQRPSKP